MSKPTQHEITMLSNKGKPGKHYSAVQLLNLFQAKGAIQYLEFNEQSGNIEFTSDEENVISRIAETFKAHGIGFGHRTTNWTFIIP